MAERRPSIRRGRINDTGTIQEHLDTGKWRWRCRDTCIPSLTSRWFDTREEAEDSWHEHCAGHFPSPAKLMRAMGISARHRT